MHTVYEKLKTCLDSVRAKTDFTPETALVLGSGLGDYAEEIQIEQTIDYTSIEGFPTSTVAGHKGRFVLGYVQDVPVVIMQGRVHYYEGYPMSDVVLPTRLMGLMGAKKLILTNAAGGVNPDYRPGDFMLITDHIKLFGVSPLCGPNVEELGPRFPDMSHVYTPALQDLARQSAVELGLPLRQGVYMFFPGPQFETPAEVRAARLLGADAVGMSTVPEAIAAAHCGMKVLGFTLCTNMAAGVLEQPLSGEEVIAAGAAAALKFSALVRSCLEKV